LGTAVIGSHSHIILYLYKNELHNLHILYTLWSVERNNILFCKFTVTTIPTLWIPESVGTNYCKYILYNHLYIYIYSLFLVITMENILRLKEDNASIIKLQVIITNRQF